MLCTLSREPLGTIWWARLGSGGDLANLKCTKFAFYNAEAEQKIAIAEANIDSAIADCNKVKDAHAQLSVDKILAALNSGGNELKELSAKIENLDKNKKDLSKQADGTSS